MERTASAPDAIAFFAPDNDLITKLRLQLLELSVRANEFERIVGNRHLATVKVRRDMEEVRESIAREQCASRDRSRRTTSWHVPDMTSFLRQFRE